MTGPALISLLFLAGCVRSLPPVAASPARSTASAGVSSPALAALLEEHWAFSLSEQPVWASSLGTREYDERLPAISHDAREENTLTRRAFLNVAQQLSPTQLTPDDQLTLTLFIHQLTDQLDQVQCRFPEWQVSPRDNPLGLLNGLPELAPLTDEASALALLKRYAAFPALLKQHMANLQRGAKDGLYGTALTLQRVIEMVERELAKPVSERATVRAIRFDPDGNWTPESIEAVRFLAEKQSHFNIEPALRDYASFLKERILPHSRDDAHPGLTYLPNGADCYAAMVRAHTTTDRSAGRIHEVGFEQLSLNRDAFRALVKTEDISALFASLRSDPDGFFKTRAEVEETATEALARATEALPEWFGVLPQATCEVRTIPDYEAPFTTIAYYQPGAPDGTRPGAYYVNSYAPTTRPRFEAEVLAFHESIPGHHLQIAIAQELPDTPAFRKNMLMTAYVEGWALYSERLADEMGLFSGDSDRIGLLSFDAWRASRLAVDTGIHEKGWGREQAVQFMLENTPLAENNIRNEVDRYINTPGQALAYKTGQLELLSLRAEAEAALGARFNITEFHDCVLGAGPLTLPLLAERVRRWIRTKLRENG